MKSTRLDTFAARIRSERESSKIVPGFDPHNGNTNAKFLFILEAPGPATRRTGQISLDNPDRTTSYFRKQLEEAEINRSEIVLWNVVPWYFEDAITGRVRAPTPKELQIGIEYLRSLVALLPNLQCIVLVGTSARKAHVALSSVTTARLLTCHHPSPRAMNARPSLAAENIAIFKYMRKTST